MWSHPPCSHLSEEGGLDQHQQDLTTIPGMSVYESPPQKERERERERESKQAYTLILGTHLISLPVCVLLES